MPSTVRRPPPPLAAWVFACTLGAMMATALACTTLLEHFARQNARRDARQFLQQSADGLRDALDRGMSQHVETIRVLSQLDQVARSDDPPAVRRALEQFASSIPHLAWLGMSDTDGRVIASVDGLLEGRNVAARPWYTGAADGLYVGDVHRAALLEKSLPAQVESWRFVDVAVPVRGNDGKLRGVLGAHLSWTWAADLKRAMVDRVLQEHQAEAMIVSADDIVLLGPSAWQGRKMPMDDADMVAVQSATRGEGRYKGLGWTVLLRQHHSVAMANFYESRRHALLAMLGLCLAMVWPLWALSRRLAAPMRALSAGLQDDPPRLALPVQPLYCEATQLAQALMRAFERHAHDAERLNELNASLEQRVQDRTAQLEIAVRERARSEARVTAITDSVPAVIAYFDAEERCRFANAQARRIHHVSDDEIGRLTLREALATRYEEHAEHVQKALRGEPASFEGRAVLRGRTVDFVTHFVPDIGMNGAVHGLYVLSYDQTALKNAERRSAAGEQRLRTIADNLPVLIAYVDDQERYRFCNGTYGQWFGIDPASMVGKTIEEATGATLYAPRRAAVQRALAGERVEFEYDANTLGGPRHLRAAYLPDVASDGRVVGFYALTSDVSSMKAAELQLSTIARTDVLTGLPNRLRFNERLSEALSRCRRSGRPIGLLFLDMDHFKQINDNYGHAAGDDVLREFGRRLAASVRETDTVARLAGDEFVVILEGLHTPDESQFVAKKIVTAMSRPFEINASSLKITTSIGIAFHSGGNIAPDDLLAIADAALYRAKSEGRNTWYLAPQDNSVSMDAAFSKEFPATS